jgi:hypothetical protein
MIRQLLPLLFFISSLMPVQSQDTLRFSGQLSGWTNINHSDNLPLWGGARYIPQLNAGKRNSKGLLFDGEISLNIYGNIGTDPFDTVYTSGKIKPYRGWIRLSGDQFELRLGLQRISFGSASMLRPLMWFDQIDPRDPLKMTDGVWGLLGRYYFQNNANIWVWGLYGNSKTKGWETIPVNKSVPEFGGRIQVPVPGGEAGISYNHRVADSRNSGLPVPEHDRIGENRFGLDAKWDITVGLWVEGSYSKKNINTGFLSNELALNAGLDYTFPAGNGLYLAYEQLLASFDEQTFAFENRKSFSLVTASYPLGLSDKLSTFIYYDWEENNVYSFLNWQKQFDRFIFYLMAYWNPQTILLPSQSGTGNLFAGQGIQFLFVFNH